MLALLVRRARSVLGEGWRMLAMGLRLFGSRDEGLKASGSSSRNQERRRGRVGVCGLACAEGMLDGKLAGGCAVGEPGRM